MYSEISAAKLFAPSHLPDEIEQAFSHTYANTREAVEVFRLAPKYPEVMEVVKQILRLSYGQYFGVPAGRLIAESLDELSQRADEISDLPEWFSRLRWRFGEYKTAHVAFSQHLRQEIISRSLLLIEEKFFAGEVVELGAKRNEAGSLMLHLFPSVKQVTGVDLVNWGAVTNPLLHFVVQDRLDIIPLPDQSADAIVIRFLLHHLPHEEQYPLLRDARRVLRPGGHLILLENTYSRRLMPPSHHFLNKRFLELDSRYKAQLATAFLDLSHAFIMDDSMPFTFTHRSVEEWEMALTAQGFRKLHEKYFGFPLITPFQGPTGALIYARR